MSQNGVRQPLILDSLDERRNVKTSICHNKTMYSIISHLIIFSIGIYCGILISSRRTNSCSSTYIDPNIADSEVTMYQNETLIEAEMLMDGSLDKPENLKIRHYLLYGFCSEDYSPGHEYLEYHHIIMDVFKKFIISKYPHWIVLNVPIQSFLSSQHYSHSALLQLTQNNVPSINLEKDKFQWIFSANCEGVHSNINIKQYYEDNKDELSTVHLEIPMTVKEYFNIKGLGDIIDDNERDELSHIVTINDNSEIFKNISDDIRLCNIWQNNIYLGSTIKHLQSLSNNRPLLMSMTGEAFQLWQKRKLDGFGTDIHFQRTKSWPRRSCFVIPYIQGICQRDEAMPNIYKNMANLWNYHRLIVDETTIENKMYEIIENKTRFCSFTVKWLLHSEYHSEALIRHTFHSMISSQYKHCDKLGYYTDKQTKKEYLCNQNNPKYKGLSHIYPNWPHHLLVECQKPYKFSINMENTASFGYQSEKIYTGLLAMTIPIYFGNQNIEETVNLDRIVWCNIDDSVIVDLRKEFIAKRKTLTNDQEIKKWALNSYGPYLQKCVDEVIEIDKNDTLYKWKLSKNIIPNNSFKHSDYDYTPISNAIINIMKYLQSPLFA